MYIWCEIVCRGCAHSVAGEFVSGQIPKRAMKAEARRQGWLFAHGDSFCGKDCLGRFEEEEGARNV